MTKAARIVGRLLEDYGAGDIEPEAGGGKDINTRFRKSGTKPKVEMTFKKRDTKPAPKKDEDDEKKD